MCSVYRAFAGRAFSDSALMLAYGPQVEEGRAIKKKKCAASERHNCTIITASEIITIK